MTHSTMPARHATRRAARVAVLAAPVLSVLMATPALAVPEGWSEPDPVSTLDALLVWVILPLAVFGLVALLASLPMFVSTARTAPGVTDPAPVEERSGLDELLGGAEEAPALEAPEETASQDRPS